MVAELPLDSLGRLRLVGFRPSRAREFCTKAWRSSEGSDEARIRAFPAHLWVVYATYSYSGAWRVAWRTWAREVVRSMLRLFGLRQNFPTYSRLHECQRQQGRIANETHLKHPATSLEHQSTPLDSSGAGAMDSISAVGSSGHGRRVKDMQITRGKLERVITIK